MANKEFLNKGVRHTDNTWNEVHAPAADHHCAGLLTMTPINPNGSVQASIRIKDSANNYRVLAKKFSLVVSGGYSESIKLPPTKAVEVKLETALQTASVTGVSLTDPLVVSIDALPSRCVVGSLVSFADIVGTTELNSGRYLVTAVTTTSVTLALESDEVDIDGTSGYTAWSSAGTMTLHELDTSYDYYEEGVPA